MPQIKITSTFAEAQSAHAAARLLTAAGIQANAVEVGQVAGETVEREGRFMARFVVIVILWSVVGTVGGAAMGAALSYTFGPRGSDGLILQMISWAVFAHVLIGLWAGYALLADRTEREMMPSAPGQLVVRIGIEDASRVREALRTVGATNIQETVDE